MRLVKRRCCGCGARKNEGEFHTKGITALCNKCSRSFGMGNGKLPNRARQNSKEWQDGPCRHQTTRTDKYKSGGKWYKRNTCKRCGTIVWEIRE